MQTYHTTTRLSRSGTLTIGGLPFKEGEEVEVTVEARSSFEGQIFRTPLAGVPVVYIDPFEPAVPPEEWEAMGNAAS